MIGFENIQIGKMIIHRVDNKENGGKLKLSQTEYNPGSEDMQKLIKKHFVYSVPRDQVYRYDEEHIVPFNLLECITRIMEGEGNFIEESYALARHLYDASQHSRIKDGHLFVMLLEDILYEDELTNGIGIFKAESAEEFLVVKEQGEKFELWVNAGYPTGKPDKGCIIVNTEKETGYRAVILDNINKINEAHYWKKDFLNLRPVDQGYVDTVNVMQMVKNFSDDFMSPENNVPREEQLHFLKKTEKFMAEKETFDIEEFKNEVIIEPELADAFFDYKESYEEEKQLPALDKFQISSKAMQKNSNKYFRSVLKLDKNFHVYVHGNAEMLERGYDEDKGMNFYKLFYREEL